VRCALDKSDHLFRGTTYDLTLNGASEIAVITGGFGNWTRGSFDRPEAEICADLIVESGVARHRLLIERNACNIGENIEFSRNALLSHQVKDLLLIEAPFHLCHPMPDNRTTLAASIRCTNSLAY
jgi:hypothetical protein